MPCPPSSARAAPPDALRSGLDRLLAFRDGLLASARFRHWAAAFPLTRPIARRRARALFDLCAGFVYSQVLLACVRLRLFDILSEGPQSAAALAPRLALPVERATRLLEAAVSLRLVARRGADRYGLGELGAALIDNPAVAAMIEHHGSLYADLGDPVALLRGESPGGALARYWPYAAAADPAGLSTEQVGAYTDLMSASQPLVSGEILDSYCVEQHHCLLDVGGGAGTFVAAAAARVPGLRAILFDLPAVAEQARQRLAACGLAERTTVVGGSFLADPLPRGADLVSLVRVLHDHDDATVLLLLRAVHRVLPVGGVVLVAEPMAGTPGAEPMGEAYFGFYLLAMGRGRPRTPEALRQLLEAAGFGRIERVPTRVPLQTQIVIARRTHGAGPSVN